MLEVLPPKLVSPPYVAVIFVCAPTLNAAVEKVAMPPTPTPPEPIDVPLSKKVTVPDGLPAPGATAATVTVKVTLCPNTDGFGAEVTLVVVLALFTVCVGNDPLLVLKLPSPLYATVTGCAATARVVVTYVATRLALSAAVTLVTPSNVNVIVPVGVPAPGALAVTIAVKVTLWPNTDGFGAELMLVSVFALLTI